MIRGRWTGETPKPARAFESEATSGNAGTAPATTARAGGMTLLMPDHPCSRAGTGDACSLYGGHPTASRARNILSWLYLYLPSQPF